MGFLVAVPVRVPAQLAVEVQVEVPVQLLVVGSPVEFPPGGVSVVVRYGMPFLFKNCGWQ